MKHLKYLRQYYDRFESVPSVTIAFVTDANSSHLIEAMRDAIRKGVPLTPAEEAAVERRTFADYYVRRDAGVQALL